VGFVARNIEHLRPGDTILVSHHDWAGERARVWTALILAVVSDGRASAEVTFLREDGQVFRGLYFLIRQVFISQK
jgi:hypothetical protein